MISNRWTTKTHSDAKQIHDFKEEQWNNTPATRKSVEEGEKPVGDILNQIANPGGQSSNPKPRKVNNELQKDDFLKLMLTQMKNQDPMNPMQSHEMAAQLAQFTSLEQLFNVNKNLEGLTKAQDPVQKFEALNFLGRAISADSRDIFHTAGDTKNELRFDLSGDAAFVKININDEKGETIKTIETRGLKKGPNKIAWNGTDKLERDARPGRYFFSVEAENPTGGRVLVKTETKGTITGINYTPEGPLLMVGDQKVRLQDVQRIEDSDLKETQNQKEETHTLAPQEAPQASNKPKVIPETTDAATTAAKGTTSDLRIAGDGSIQPGGTFGSR